MVETCYKIPDAPRLALLADLHGRPYQSVIDSLQRHKPELICIAGDIIYGVQPEDNRSPLDTQENVMPFLRACSTISPSFLSLGNHERILDDEDLDRIRSCGITVLDNDYTTTGKIVIGGLTSAHCFSACNRVEEKVPYTAWLSSFTAVRGFHILLSHHPEYWSVISPYPIELCLSAHAHGGQWRIFNHGVFAPGQGFWPSLTSGVHDGRLVISRGLSNTAKVPRLFNPTEVVYVEGTYIN